MRTTTRWIGPVAALLLVLSALPAGAADRSGTWKGDTSQGFKIAVIVGDDQRVKDVKVTVEYENDLCVRAVTWEFGLDVRIREDDTFRVDLVDDRDERDTLVVRGEFVTRRRIEGTFRGGFFDGGRCNDLSVHGTWVAKRV